MIKAKMDNKRWIKKMRNKKNNRCNFKLLTFLVIKIKEKSELLTINKVYLL